MWVFSVSWLLSIGPVTTGLVRLIACSIGGFALCLMTSTLQKQNGPQLPLFVVTRVLPVNSRPPGLVLGLAYLVPLVLANGEILHPQLSISLGLILRSSHA